MLLGILCQFNVQIPVCQTFIDIFDKQINNSGNVFFRQRTEHDDLIQTVQKFRTEMRFQFVHNKLFIFRADVSVLIDSFQQVDRTDIGCHDQDGILKVYRPSLRVRDPPVIQYLQEDVEYIRMCLFHLIKEDNRIRFSPDCLCELSAFVISDISRRCSDQSGHGIFLHILTHINTNHVLFIVKQAFRQCLGKLRLSDSGRSKEQEGSDRLCRVFDTRFGTDDSFCHFGNTFVLSDHPFMKLLIQVKSLAPLTFI